jgi:hypothetical protein
MAKNADFERAKRLTASLDGVEIGTAYGTPALKVNGKMFAVIPNHPQAEPNSLCVLIDFPERDELIAAEPDTYYLKPHYQNHACVLVRMPRIRDDALQDLLLMAWRFTSRKARTTRPKIRRRGAPAPRNRPASRRSRS